MATNPTSKKSPSSPKEDQSPSSDQDDDLDLDQYSTEVLEAALGVLRAREAAAKKCPTESKQQ
jgi:hypothetical protein